MSNVAHVQPYKAYYEMDQIEKIMAYEQGDLQDCEIIDLFQELVDSGIVWQLQGHYGRMAKQLIEAGYISEEQQTEDK